MAGLYEDMGHILSRYYKFGEITEDEMKNRLGINETKEEDCGCGCGGTTPGGCGDSINEAKVDTILKRIKSAYDKSKNKKLDIKKLKDQLKTYKKLGASDKKDQIKAGEMFLKSIGKSINEQPVTVHNRTSNGNIVTVLRESDLNEEETKLYEFGKKVTRLMEKNCPTNPSKWSSYKSQAKQKFDVYPSAYANGWAAKKYKAAGGGWKKC